MQRHPYAEAHAARRWSFPAAFRESAVKAHGVEALFHILKFLLADNDISADDQRDPEKAGLVTLFPHPAAIQLPLPIQAGNNNGVRV